MRIDQIQVGESRVYHKSNPQNPMLASKINGELITCVWYSSQGERLEVDFPFAELELVPAPPPMRRRVQTRYSSGHFTSDNR